MCSQRSPCSIECVNLVVIQGNLKYSEVKQPTLSYLMLCARLALCQPILHFAKLTTSPWISLKWKAEFDTGLFWPLSCTVYAHGFCNLYMANFLSLHFPMRIPQLAPQALGGLLCVSGVLCTSYQRIVSFVIFFPKSKFFEVLGTLPTAWGMCLSRVTIDEAACQKVIWEWKVYLAYISWVRLLEKGLLNQLFHLFGREFWAHAEKPRFQRQVNQLLAVVLLLLYLEMSKIHHYLILHTIPCEEEKCCVKIWVCI